jgi:hypothetical protein
MLDLLVLLGFDCCVVFGCFCRRNEAIIGPRPYLNKQMGGAITVAGDDPKKFAAAVAEYSKKVET